MYRTPMMHNNSNQVVKILILPIRGERDLEFECDGFTYLPNNATVRESFKMNNQNIRSLVDGKLFQSLIEIGQ
jgi:phage pi2 protein 07